MIKAVLLDLDNTLLLNPDARFAAEYIRALDAFFREASGFTGAAATIRQIMDTITGSTGAGTQTNLQQMLAIFAAHTGQTPAALAALFEAFYTRVYPSLAGCVQPVAGANDLIQRLVAAGLAVVIATNPIYPETAIRQRMTWAGLPQSADLYALITTADVMHFAKPDAAYYAEIVARVGVEPDEALLIGDSLVNDIVPAGRLGLSTYHITPAAPAAAATAGGTLADFARLIQADDWRHRFQPRPLAPEMIVPQYRGNIGALHGLLT
ncbi:MAG: HAD family hydrolase, partial [Anaerolineae bacterium]|nr:HAD family hydrolase [Anaerolineae bacterium]